MASATGQDSRPRLPFRDLGVTAYADALSEQRRWAERVEAEGLDGVVLLTEHAPVLTVGRLAGKEELGREIDAWRKEGIEVVATDRGGRITYHGPGQIVLYPVVNLKRLGRSLHQYIRGLEETGIDFLAAYGVAAARVARHTGVWVGRNKIAAIGIHVRRWITTHGMAVNVNNPSEVFGRFVPCGIRDRGVTSLCELLGAPVDLGGARQRLLASFERVFQVQLTHE